MFRLVRDIYDPESGDCIKYSSLDNSFLFINEFFDSTAPAPFIKFNREGVVSMNLFFIIFIIAFSINNIDGLIIEADPLTLLKILFLFSILKLFKAI